MRTCVVVTLLALVALACDKSATPLSPGVSRFCIVALSGAVTGTFDCQAASVTWSSVDSTGTYQFTVTGSGTTPGIAVSITWLGEPLVGAYTSADSGAAGSLFIQTSNGQIWRASAGGSSAAVGSYELDFTSVVNDLQEQNGNLYATEGSLNALLPADTASGATNVIVLSATF